MTTQIQRQMPFQMKTPDDNTRQQNQMQYQMTTPDDNARWPH
jgi:hypothetical protein